MQISRYWSMCYFRYSYLGLSRFYLIEYRSLQMFFFFFFLHRHSSLAFYRYPDEFKGNYIMKRRQGFIVELANRKWQKQGTEVQSEQMKIRLEKDNVARHLTFQTCFIIVNFCQVNETVLINLPQLKDSRCFRNYVFSRGDKRLLHI